MIGSSLRGEIGADVIRALKQKGMLVAADMQGFVRVLRGQSLVYEALARDARDPGADRYPKKRCG